MLTLQFVPSDEIIGLNSEKKLQKLLRIIRQDKIVLMEGMLKPGEETKLIQETMDMVNGKFKGVEVCTVQSQERMSIIKKSIFELLGTKSGMTIIGPASIIKEIKRDPNKIQLLMQSPQKRK